MLTNSFLKLQSADSNTGVFHSDNMSTYLYITDFKDEFNGLWSNGFHLWHAIYPQSKAGSDKLPKIVSKSLTPIDCSVSFGQNAAAAFSLFDSDKGLLAELRSPTGGFSFGKSTVIILDIGREFTIADKSDSHLILRYDGFDREGFEIPALYMSISTARNEIFDNISEDKHSVKLTVKCTGSNRRSKDKLTLIFNYNENAEVLTKQAAHSVANIDKIKKNHNQNTFLPVKYVSTNVENSYFNKALTWAMLSSSDFVMQKVGNTGIWAGYHWFDNNWGRDTFISLPGVSLVSGRYEEARHIIETFIHRICNDKKSPAYGKIPNVIFNEENIIYNTSDATPLLLREMYEYYLYSGDTATMIGIIRNITMIVDAVYMANKDENNFMSQPDSDDWMDAKLDGKYPLSPRGDKAVEIQALWYTALHAVAVIIRSLTLVGNVFNDSDKASLLSKAKTYTNEANKLRDSIRNHFCTKDAPYIYDHINIDGKPDMQIRPNGLLAIRFASMPNIPTLFPDEICIRYLRYIHPRLVYLHGISSLDWDDDHFHARHIDPMYHKDAAYHNGCCWLWLSGAYITAACKYGLQNVSFRHTANLTEQLMNIGALGTLSELNDPYTPNGHIVPSGTYSQAWSVAEYCRSFYQDYLGIYPDVPSRTLYISPSLPSTLGAVKTTFRYGYGESISVYVRANAETGRLSYIDIRSINLKSKLKVIIEVRLSDKGDKHKILRCETVLNGIGDYMRINLDSLKDGSIKLQELTVMNGCELRSLTTEELRYENITADQISFAPPLTAADLHKLKTQNVKDYYEKIARKNKPTTVT